MTVAEGVAPLIASLDKSYAAPVYETSPLSDARWSEFLARHPQSSMFHSVDWLEALHRSYRYEPVVLTTSPPGAVLENGIVFCEVKSWLTGRRLVSLPFSDHCDPLCHRAEDMAALTTALKSKLLRDKLDYIEWRPLESPPAASGCFESRYGYYLHRLDLKPDLELLFKRFHKNSTQRKIRRAEREGLTYEAGRSQRLIEAFCRLFLLTRRRHGIPPQPKHWFYNLVACGGDAVCIRVAFKDGRPIAAALTVRHKKTVTYKYGCSDSRYHSLGGMHLVLWNTIQELKRAGIETLDLGRTDLDNAGLATFKDRWGAERSLIHYSRLSASPRRSTYYDRSWAWELGIVRSALSHVPSGLWYPIGRLLYKHIG